MSDLKIAFNYLYGLIFAAVMNFGRFLTEGVIGKIIFFFAEKMSENPQDLAVFRYLEMEPYIFLIASIVIVVGLALFMRFVKFAVNLLINPSTVFKSFPGRNEKPVKVSKTRADEINDHLLKVDSLGVSYLHSLMRNYFLSKGFEVELPDEDTHYDMVVINRDLERAYVKLITHNLASDIDSDQVDDFINYTKRYIIKDSMVIANADFTRASEIIAEAAGVDLIDRKGLFSLLSED